MFGWIVSQWRYGWYVFKHKWFVFWECLRVGRPVAGLMHDLSKLRPSEWLPYAAYFYPGGVSRNVRNKSGYYKPTDTGDEAFDFAWLLHQKRNRHHWQWWVLPEDDGGMKILKMSHAAMVEMVCDWRGAGNAQGYGRDPLKWYKTNKDKMLLHEQTRQWIEAEIGA